MIVNTQKLAAMRRKGETLHAIYRDLSRQFDEARQILARLRNPNIDICSGRLQDDIHPSVVARIEAAQAECDRLLQLRGEAADQQRQYGESVDGVIRWAEERMKRPGYRPSMPTLGDSR